MTTESKAVTKTEPDGPATTLRKLLEARKDQLALLLPVHLTPDRLIRIAVNCVAKNPDLAACSTSSVFASVLAAAELGLEPGGALGHAALVPYKGVCQLQVMYQGWAHLLRQSGDIAGIRAVIVNAKDRFRYVQGDEPCIEHEPFLDGDPGPMTRVYCVVTFKDGFKQREVMSKAQVDKIRDSAQAKNGPAWTNHYDEQAKKTVFKRLRKWLPLSTEKQRRAAEIDDEGGDYVDGEVVQHHHDAALPEETATQRAKAAIKQRRLSERVVDTSTELNGAAELDPAVAAQEAAIDAEIAAKAKTTTT